MYICRGSFKLKTITQMNEQSSHRFYWYSLYSWGVPVLLCVFTIILQVIPLKDFPDSVQPYLVKPGIGKGRCWFKQGLPTFLYNALIDIGLNFINGLFMMHAAYLLYNDQLKYYCCSKKQRKPVLRTHVIVNHVKTFKIRFLVFVLCPITFQLMMILNEISQIVTGNEYWKVMIVIQTLHSTFLFFVIIQLCKNEDVSIFVEKFINRASEIRCRILFVLNFDCPGAEVSRL